MSAPFLLALLAVGPPAPAPDFAKELLPPVRLQAAGKPIDTEIGHAAPFVADFDGDGVKDLLVGQFGDGILRIYRNIGTNTNPKYAAGVKFKDGGKDGRVPTGWCVGFGPQLVDLDGDGHIDLLSGSWPGEIFFFKGGPGRTFAAPVKLKDIHGKTINIGGGRRPDSGGMILIAGDATFEKNAKGKTVIRYEGEDIEVPEGRQAGITGTASAAHAVDWDGDGRIDLLVGEIGGAVHLVPNEAKDKGYAFGKERSLSAGGKPIRVPGGDAGPFAADWDGDGKMDLLVGAGDGSVWFYRNIGSKSEPKLAAGVQLIAPGETRYGPDAPKEPTRGVRAKVCAVDYDGDGRLDLLVGDFATQKPDLPEATAAEKAKQDRAKKELDEVMADYRKLFGPKAVKDKAEKEKAQKQMQSLMQRMQELRKAVPPEYENHGWVWLFKRKPTDPTAAR